MRKVLVIAAVTAIAVATLTACDPALTCSEGQHKVDRGNSIYVPGHSETTTTGTGKNKRTSSRYISGYSRWDSHWVCER